MIDRTLGFATTPQESYYFQLIPISLAIVNPTSQLPAPGTTYRFTVFKGQQKFDENRVPIEAAFITTNKVPVLPITTCRLNFYSPSINRQRKIEFNLKMVQRQNNEDYQVGEYAINVNELVDAFKEKSVTRHELKVNFSEDYELQFEIYVDTSRVNLEKNIRDKKFDRASKSPLRTRREGEGQNSARKNFGQESKVESKVEQIPSKDIEVEVSAPTQEIEVIPSPEAQSPKEIVEQTTPPAVQQKAKAISSAVRSQKNQKPQGSVKSKASLPLVQTKFKPISKIDAPAEIKTSESQRLGQADTAVTVIKTHNEQSLQQKIFLWAFLGVGLVLIYWAMLPNSRV